MLLKNYNLDDVYNADEFGLFFKLMPDKSFVFKTESYHGGKLSKERVTVMACTNATGTHKVKLFVIGKSKSPRCFKGVHTLPVPYDHQNRAWMTGELYIAWLKELDLQSSKLQPLDQRIIKVMKQRYRKKLVQRHLNEMAVAMENADKKTSEYLRRNPLCRCCMGLH